MVAATKPKKKRAPLPPPVLFKVRRKKYMRDIPEKNQGVRSKIGVTQFMAHVLEMNERFDKRRKLTDEMIAHVLLREFPHVKNVRKLKLGQITIGYWRSLYNCGHLTKGKKLPDRKSHRYADNGEIANLWTGRPLNEGEAPFPKKPNKRKPRAKAEV